MFTSEHMQQGAGRIPHGSSVVSFPRRLQDVSETSIEHFMYASPYTNATDMVMKQDALRVQSLYSCPSLLLLEVSMKLNLGTCYSCYPKLMLHAPASCLSNPQGMQKG